jgi:hypothetical protein
MVAEDAGRPTADGQPRKHAPEPDVVSTQAEAGLQSEAKDIEEQARQAWTPDNGENLLSPAKDKPRS